MSDQEIIKGLKSLNPFTRRRIENKVYKKFKTLKISSFRNDKISREEIDELYVNAILELFQNIRKGKFKNKSSIQTYLFTIIRNLKFSHFNNRNKWNIDLSIYEKVIKPDSRFEEKVAEAKEILRKVKSECTEILNFYFKGFTIQIIADRLNISIHQARYKLDKCIENLGNNSKQMVNG